MTSFSPSPDSQPPDLALLERFVVQHDHRAFDSLVQLHAPMVLAAARRIAPKAAEDVAQIVFTELARRAGSLRRIQSLGAWLHRVTLSQARLAVRQEIRTRSKHAAYALAMNTMSVASADPMDEALPHLDAALGDLSAADRDLIFMRFHERLPFKVAADRLGKSEASLRQQASRAIDRLTLSLKKRGVVVPAGSLALVLGTLIAPAEVAAADTALIAVAARTATTPLSWTTSRTTTWAITSNATKATLAAAAALVAIAIPLSLHLNRAPQSIISTTEAPSAGEATTKKKRERSPAPLVIPSSTFTTDAPRDQLARQIEMKNYSLAQAPINNVLIDLADEAHIELFSTVKGDDLRVNVIGRMAPFDAIKACCDQLQLRLFQEGTIWIVEQQSARRTRPTSPALPGTEALRNARPQTYTMVAASVRDVLRFLATDAQLDFVLLPDDHPLMQKTVTFRCEASPFVVLERVCNAMDATLQQGPSTGIWQITDASHGLMAPGASRTREAALQSPQPVMEFAFAKANLNDVLRYLARQANIHLTLPPDDVPVSNTAVTFKLRTTPLKALETVTRSYGLQLSESGGRWWARPAGR